MTALIAKFVVVAFVVVEFPVMTRLPLMVEEAVERKPARVVAPVNVAPEIVGDVPKTSAPVPVSSDNHPASCWEVEKREDVAASEYVPSVCPRRSCP